MKRYSVVVIGGVLFFFGLHRFFATAPGFFENVASYISYPILQTHAYVVDTFNNFLGKRATNAQLQRTVQQLEQELITTQAQLIANAAQLQYAKETQDVRQFAERYETEQAQLAHVLLKQLNDQQQSYLVDAGSNKGVTVDMVAVYKNCLLGRVATVYPTYSKIQLITDIGCKVAAFCASTEAKGIHEGRNKADEAVLNFVSHLETVRIGDLVISSGSGLVFPRGFMLGSIKDAQIDGLYYAITVEPPIDLNKVEYLYLIKK